MTDMSADTDLATEIDKAYRQLRADIEALLSSNPTKAPDAILSLIFDRLATERPSYFRGVLDRWGADLVDRDIRDPATFRLLFGAVLGQSPLNGAALPQHPSNKEISI
ncbi:hypothetical protein D3C71_338650 [compost metagenome]